MLGETKNQDAIDPALEPPFRLGSTTIDPKAHEVTFGGSKERIQPQNLKVLIALAQKRGSLVTRDELVRRCWDGRFISDDVINRSISTLRQLAGRMGAFEIETVSRAGYRLVANSPSRSWRRWRLGVVLGLASVAIGAGVLGWSNLRRQASDPTIGILPFATASSDRQERELATGARDAIAHALSRSDFQVALVDREPGTGQSTPDFLTSADVSSDAGRIVIAVNVVDGRSHVIVYSHRFEGDLGSASGLLDQISAQVAGSLGWTASLLKLERNHPADPAITASLFEDAGGGYENAYKLASKYPNSPAVQFDLAYYAAYEILEIPPDQRAAVADVGRQAAARARILVPQFGGNELLWCLYHGRGRIRECEDHLRAGLRYDPDYPWIAESLAQRMKDVGRFWEARRFATESLGHDPYQMQKIGLMVRMLEATGADSEAESLFETGTREWPGEPVLYWDRIYGTLDRGDFRALEAFLKSLTLEAAQAVQPAMPVLQAVNANDLPQVHELCSNEPELSFKRDVCTMALARLGDIGGGMNLALGTYADRIGRTPAQEERLWLYSLRYNDTDILMGAGAAPLRRDPRYLELARRIGALDYWRSGRLPDFCQPPRPEPICSRLQSQQ